MRKLTAILVALFAIAGLSLAFVYPHIMIAPGDMLVGHADIESDCFACHAPLRGAVSSKCIVCHAVDGIGRKTTKGMEIAPTTGKTPFHQQLIEQDCTSCHSDHKAPVGVKTRLKHFSHNLLREETREHCENCHTKPQDDLHRVIPANCAQCHSSEAWKPARFDHAKFFELDHDHNVSCTTCHIGGNLKQYTCYGCHEHRQNKIREEHLEEGITAFENCVSCHRNAHDEPENDGKRSEHERDHK